MMVKIEDATDWSIIPLDEVEARVVGNLAQIEESTNLLQTMPQKVICVGFYAIVDGGLDGPQYFATEVGREDALEEMLRLAQSYL